MARTSFNLFNFFQRKVCHILVIQPVKPRLRGSEKAHSTSQRSVDSAIADERRAQVKEYTTLLQSLIRVSQKGTFFFFINVHFFLFVQKETNQRKRATEMAH